MAQLEAFEAIEQVDDQSQGDPDTKNLEGLAEVLSERRSGRLRFARLTALSIQECAGAPFRAGRGGCLFVRI